MFVQSYLAFIAANANRRGQRTLGVQGGIKATGLEYRRVAAERLVGTLDAVELQVIKCIVSGMSGRDIAALTAIGMADVERIRASMMSKLSARRIADAVRIGLYAGVD